jgi:hypothetical protein
MEVDATWWCIPLFQSKLIMHHTQNEVTYKGKLVNVLN